ncbi:sensor histidine kinase [Nitrospirillum sp. BR 11828]|uniref:sensor histidine kinase n=1 Tax=Nitrospirillum sp. BR 11828 TaxID=3104325 RepID=UPI002ACA208E|nr:ATP-binding protein [Nitrospirillum sp. BR 11828]MDZ5646893.1 ATP-binding protein [Nitrospirillum sp. BR 11828]
MPRNATALPLALTAAALAAPGFPCLRLVFPDAPLPLVVAGSVASLVAAGVCLARLAGQRHAATTQAARAEALLSGCADEWVAWRHGRVIGASASAGAWLGVPDPRPGGRMDEIAQAFDAAEDAALRRALRDLDDEGVPFSLQMSCHQGRRTLMLIGRPGTSPVPLGDDGDPSGRISVLWLRDVTATAADAAQADQRRQVAEDAAARLRAALELLPFPLWTRRSDGSLLWCNQAYGTAVGLSPAAVVEQGVELVTDPGAGRALAARALAEGQGASETRHVVVAGQRQLLRLVETPLAAPLATPLEGGAALMGHALDLTREQELSSELERHIAAHGDVLEHLGSAIAIYGADTKLKFHNRSYARLWGLDEPWLATEPTYGEVLEDLRSRRRLQEEVDFPRWKRGQMALFTNLTEPREDMVHLPDGTTLRTIAVPHPFGGLMFVLEDVTNALALESSYNTLMAVQQETLDNLAEGVAVFGGDGRLKLWNPSFARIWGLKGSDLNGEPHITQVIDKLQPLLDHDGDWPARRRAMIADLLERSSYAGRLERTDRSIVDVSNVPLPDGAVLISVLDITDSVRVEEALRASNEALATADRLKSEFIANVSYQLRTPLNAIMGFAEILNNQYFGALNERQADYTKGVLEASRRLLALINDILDLATIEAGFMTLDRSPVDVGQLLEAVSSLTLDWARKQDVTLLVQVPYDIGTLDADERRLKQALYNLVSNAVKFTPPGGQVTLSAKRQMGEGGPEMVLSVSDTGIGIPAADRQRVFNKFERGDVQNHPAGAGLGLSLVKSFVELHGGRVEISDSDHGTLIQCHLPLRHSAVMAV